MHIRMKFESPGAYVGPTSKTQDMVSLFTSEHSDLLSRAVTLRNLMGLLIKFLRVQLTKLDTGQNWKK